MKRKNKVWIIVVLLPILTAFLLTACQDSDTESIKSTPSTTSTTGDMSCSGRTASILEGPTNLYLPYPNGASYTVSQTWNGTYSHSTVGREHAVDFPMEVNDDIWPVASGRVMAVKKDSNTTCTNNCNFANYVYIDHGNGFIGKYFHFCQNCVDVAVGQEVSSDTKIGGAGNTGWSTETHLHFELTNFEDNCTVTYGFANIDAGSRTALTKGTSYTSLNAGMAFSSYTPSKINGSVYENVGITLTEGIDWYLSASDTVTVKGNLTAAAKAEGSNGVAVFLVDPLTNTRVDSPATIVFETTVTDSFEFSYTIPAVSAGRYNLGISKSTNGSYFWNNAPIIVVHN